jgi:DNA-binding transcriptional regulator GbsR (MarR family)
VARFVVENPGSINLAKLEPNKAWFIDLMARCAASTSEGVRDKGQRIYALANARPDLSHAQIADMTGSTQKAVSVTISKLRSAERQRVAA